MTSATGSDTTLEIGTLMQFTLLGAIFIAIDVVIIACCFYLIFRK